MSNSATSTIIVVADAVALAARAADAIADVVRAKPNAHLGLATGTSPLGTYAELARRAEAGEVDLSAVTLYAIDEFGSTARTAGGTNHTYFRDHIRFPFRAAHVPDPEARDLDAEIRAFAARIAQSGGLDLCVVGIGMNGHVAFNEPGASRDSRARIVPLTPESRAAHMSTFGGLAHVPNVGMTLGIADILESRRILAVAQGTAKTAIVRSAIENTPGADVPATWLRSHPDLTWLLDESAAARLTRR